MKKRKGKQTIERESQREREREENEEKMYELLIRKNMIIKGKRK